MRQEAVLNPASAPYATTMLAPTTSTTHTLQEQTELIEVQVEGGSCYILFGTGTVAAASGQFHQVVQQDVKYRNYPLPKEAKDTKEIQLISTGNVIIIEQ